MSADIRGCLKPGVTHNWWTCPVDVFFIISPVHGYFYRSRGGAISGRGERGGLWDMDTHNLLNTSYIRLIYLLCTSCYILLIYIEIRV